MSRWHMSDILSYCSKVVAAAHPRRHTPDICRTTPPHTGHTSPRERNKVKDSKLLQNSCPHRRPVANLPQLLGSTRASCKVKFLR